jgi:adenylate cyclase
MLITCSMAHPRRRRRGISIRWSLFVSLLSVILVGALGVFVIRWFANQRTVASLSATFIDKASDQTESELRRFLDPVDPILGIAERYAREGFLDFQEADTFDRLMWPLMAGFHHISAISTGDAGGRGLTLLHTQTGWISREVRPNQWGSRASFREWSPDFDFQREYWRELEFDPRTRPWFVGAMAAPPGQVVWTEPYVFFTTKEPGITASSRFHLRGGDEVVVACDVLLTELTRFTQRMHVTENGRVMVLAEDGRTLALPADERFNNFARWSEAILHPPAAMGLGFATAAEDVWSKLGRPNETPFRFDVGDAIWWGGARRVSLGNRSLWIMVLVPEEDFLANLRRREMRLLWITIGVTVMAVVATLVLSRMYSEPLQHLVKSSQKIQHLHLEDEVSPRSSLFEVQFLAGSLETMRCALQSFARYVPIEVVRELVRRGEAAEVGGRTETITVFFSDVIGFTALAESMDPRALTEHMSDYFTLVIGELRQHRATIDKMVGDAVMAFWGAPRKESDHARLGAEAALDVQAAIEKRNPDWVAAGNPPLPSRIGLCTGQATVGNVGSYADRLSYTALGDTVNLASRLESLNNLYGTRILAPERTRHDAGGGFVWRELDSVRVKGKQCEVRVFELVGRAGQVPEERLQAIRDYQEALAAYRNREFSRAAGILECERLARDMASIRLRALCLGFAERAPNADWEAVTTLSEK